MRDQDVVKESPAVARAGAFGVLLLGAAILLVLARPRSAPGPSEELEAKVESARREAAAAREQLQRLLQDSVGDDVAAAVESAGEVGAADAVAALRQQIAAAEERLREANQHLATLEEELRQAELDQQQYPVPEYLESVFGTGKVMLAVTGASGSGKSSLVNSVRRLRARDRGAAKVGVTETTLAPQMFSFPQRAGFLQRAFYSVVEKGRALKDAMISPNARERDLVQVGDRVLLRDVSKEADGEVAEVTAKLGDGTWDAKLPSGEHVKVARHQVTGVLAECVIWDLPGVGTPKFPQSTYIQRMGIRYFDVVILMTCTRFTEAELLLVKELKRWKVPFFLVRNKVDSDVEAEVEREEENDIEVDEERRKEIERQTVSCIKDYFKSEYSLDRVYCISTKRKLRDQYDFTQLEQDVEAAIKAQRGSSTAGA